MTKPKKKQPVKSPSRKPEQGVRASNSKNESADRSARTAVDQPQEERHSDPAVNSARNGDSGVRENPA